MNKINKWIDKRLLHTLKDIRFGRIDEFVRKLVIKVLKKEAIKWYKDMEYEQPYGKHTKYVMKWIKIFFNLKEEDIK